MDKISKLINKIPQKEALKIADSLEKLVNGDIKNQDIKKLKGHADIYRLRIGKYRVIFQKNSSKINILEISKRNDLTYKNY